MQELLNLPGSFAGAALGASADGSVIVGYGTPYNLEAVRWTTLETVESLGYVASGSDLWLPGDYFNFNGVAPAFSYAYGISGDGSVVVGQSGAPVWNGDSERIPDYSEAFRWTSAGGMQGLGHLPPAGPLPDPIYSYYSAASAVSADGSIVVGASSDFYPDSGAEAFIWDSAHGMRKLSDVLHNDFGLDLTGWVLVFANAISPDGRNIVGTGLNPNGQYEAFLAKLGNPPCASIEVHAARHIVGSGPNPSTSKQPLTGIMVGLYDASAGSCARQQDQQGDGISWQEFAAIVSNCTAVQSGTTDADGVATIAAVPGDYIAISHFDSDGDGSLDQYIGVSAGGVECGVTKKYLQLLVDAQGNKKPGKTTRLTGSELLIIEPEYVIWDDMIQLYPFVLESVGDWGVTTSVTPPDGFVADYSSLSASVENEMKAVQFTITEVGSEAVPTQMHFEVSHNGQSRVVDSKVDIRLTPAYAASRGFDVADLRTKGLIVDRRDAQRGGPKSTDPRNAR
jgi:hypothetical protein